MRGDSVCKSVPVTAAIIFALAWYISTWSTALAGGNVNPSPTRDMPPGPGFTHNPCPPGQKVEFKFGHTSLYVDLAMANLSTVHGVEERGASACPTGPVEGVELSFYELSLRGVAPREYIRRGLPPHIRINAVHEDLSKTSNSLVSGPRRQIPGGAVEEVTPAYVAPPGRTYRLIPDESQPFTVACGSFVGGGNRHCTASYEVGSDFRVTYEFDPNRIPIADQREVTADNSLREPDDFLKLDAHVRAFINDLKRKP